MSDVLTRCCCVQKDMRIMIDDDDNKSPARGYSNNAYNTNYKY